MVTTNRRLTKRVHIMELIKRNYATQPTIWHFPETTTTDTEHAQSLLDRGSSAQSRLYELIIWLPHQLPEDEKELLLFDRWEYGPELNVETSSTYIVHIYIIILIHNEQLLCGHKAVLVWSYQNY